MSSPRQRTVAWLALALTGSACSLSRVVAPVRQTVVPVAAGRSSCTVIVNELADRRSDLILEESPFMDTPLVPWASARSDRPDLERNPRWGSGAFHEDSYAQDLSWYVLDASRRLGRCSQVRFHHGAAVAPARADYLVAGALLETSDDWTVYTYGLSLLRILPWLLGAPMEHHVVRLRLDLSITDVASGATAATTIAGEAAGTASFYTLASASGASYETLLHLAGPPIDRFIAGQLGPGAARPALSSGMDGIAGQTEWIFTDQVAGVSLASAYSGTPVLSTRP